MTFDRLHLSQQQPSLASVQSATQQPIGEEGENAAFEQEQFEAQML